MMMLSEIHTATYTYDTFFSRVLILTGITSDLMAATSLTAQPPRLNPSAKKSAEQGVGGWGGHAE